LYPAKLGGGPAATGTRKSNRSPAVERIKGGRGDLTPGQHTKRLVGSGGCAGSKDTSKFRLSLPSPMAVVALGWLPMEPSLLRRIQGDLRRRRCRRLEEEEGLVDIERSFA